jgi:hypothetical protein
MSNDHPITPPPELVQQWWDGTHGAYYEFAAVATQAARWGADQQLEQCEKYWMTHGISPQGVVAMRYALRPKPPSLKEQALKALAAIEGDFNTVGDRADTIRRALEQLDKLNENWQP